MTTLQITEVYRALQGESSYVGRPCTMVRLARCDLRCAWCDTEYSFSGGETLVLAELCARIESRGLDLVEVTGGEPLLQDGVYPLFAWLLAQGARVLLETGGHRSIARVPEAVVKILDVKCPGSGESARMDWKNLSMLSPHDELKFVLADRRDYDFALETIRCRDLAALGVIIHFSPVLGLLDPRDLTRWMIEDGPPARLSLQQHRVIWGAGATAV